MSKVIMTLKGNKFLSNTWSQKLEIQDDGVYGEVLVIGKRVQMFLPYENIAQINVIRGVFASDLSIVNKGGSQNLTIKALNKFEADKAKELINGKIKEVNSVKISTNSADEIQKLAELRDKNILTEDEFQAKKKQILGV